MKNSHKPDFTNEVFKYCGTNEGCVEIAYKEGYAAVGDTKRGNTPERKSTRLVFPGDAWSSFLNSINPSS